MPGLISLKTDLKDLKYDSMPLGSDAPYVTKNINKPPSSNGTSMQITKRVDDLARIGKMFINKPGIKYLTNEALLQQEDLGKKIAQARGKGIKALATTVLQQAGKTAIGTVKILGSTLAQVPVNGTGTHFIRGFKTDTYLQPIGASPLSNFAQFFGAGGIEGAPLALQGKPIPTGVRGLNETTPEPGTIPGSISNQEVVGDLRQLSFEDYTITAKGQIVEIMPFETGSAEKKTSYIGTLEKGTPSKPNQNETGSINQGNFGTPVITDFRSGSLTTYSFNYQAPTIRKETRINLGDQGAAKKSSKNYTITDSTGIDKINQLDILSRRPGDTDKDTIKDGRDLVKFYFEIITPSQPKAQPDPKSTSLSQFLYFRAFLDSFDDNYSAQWDARKYVGRAESFYTYGGFDRSINFSFKIAAASRAEMKPLYRKMVYLASATAPTYQQNGGFMRGTLAKVTIGSYLSQVPGVIESVKYSWNTEYPWEIAMQNPENGIDDDMQELPMIMDCSISFKPIHSFAPQTGLEHFITNPAPEGGSKPFF